MVQNKGDNPVDVCFTIINDLDVSLKGKVTGIIRPKNFKGKSCAFTLDVNLNQGENSYHVEVTVPDPQLWWPNGHGLQPLYFIDISFEDMAGMVQSCTDTFGIRTIEMAPLPGGPRCPDAVQQRKILPFLIACKGTGDPAFKGLGWWYARN